MTMMPCAERMPAASADSTAAAGKKYMSLKQVMPPRSISAQASSVPSRTNSGDTCFFSAGQMCSCNQRMSGDEPRDQGVVGEIDRRVVGKPLARICGRQHCFDLAVAYRDGVVAEDAARRLDGNEPAGKSDEALFYLGEPWISTTTRRL